MKDFRELLEAKSYVIKNKWGTIFRIAGFKKGADTDKIGDDIVKELEKLKFSAKEIAVKL